MDRFLFSSTPFTGERWRALGLGSGLVLGSVGLGSGLISNWDVAVLFLDASYIYMYETMGKVDFDRPIFNYLARIDIHASLGNRYQLTHKT